MIYNMQSGTSNVYQRLYLLATNANNIMDEKTPPSYFFIVVILQTLTKIPRYVCDSLLSG